MPRDGELAQARDELARRGVAVVVPADDEHARVAAVARDVRRLAADRDDVDLRVAQQTVRDRVEPRVHVRRARGAGRPASTTTCVGVSAPGPNASLSATKPRAASVVCGRLVSEPGVRCRNDDRRGGGEQHRRRRQQHGERAAHDRARERRPRLARQPARALRVERAPAEEREQRRLQRQRARRSRRAGSAVPPRPSVRMNGTGTKNRSASPIATASPEKTTARPAPAIVRTIAASRRVVRRAAPRGSGRRSAASSRSRARARSARRGSSRTSVTRHELRRRRRGARASRRSCTRRRRTGSRARATARARTRARASASGSASASPRRRSDASCGSRSCWIAGWPVTSAPGPTARRSAVRVRLRALQAEARLELAVDDAAAGAERGEPSAGQHVRRAHEPRRAAAPAPPGRSE